MATPTRISMTSAVVCGDEEEQVFIASAKGRNGLTEPLHPKTLVKTRNCDLRNTIDSDSSYRFKWLCGFSIDFHSYILHTI